MYPPVLRGVFPYNGFNGPGVLFCDPADGVFFCGPFFREDDAFHTDFEAVFEMDADFSHDPVALDEFLVEIESHDLVLGSRYLYGITVVNWPLRRLILSVGANRYAGFVTGMSLKDCTGGFKCFRRSTLEQLPLDRIKSDGYSFQIEMNYHCWKRKLKIREIPIMFVDRQVGVSKMSKRIIVEAIWMVWALRFRRIP